MSGTPGLAEHADGEVRARANRIRSDVEPAIQPPHDVHQTDGVHVKYCRRVRIVSLLGRIAGHAKNVVQADRRSSQQIRLNRKQIAVAAGVMQNRVDPGVLLNLDAEALPAHSRRGLRRIVHIDGVHAQPRQRLRAPSISFEQSMPRGGTISTMVMKLAARRSTSRSASVAPSGAGGVSLLSAGAAPPTSTCVCLVESANGRAHGPNVIRRSAAAAAHQSARRRRSLCAQSWPCIPANTDRCCGPRLRAACRHWAWPPAAAWSPRASPRSQSAPWLARWSSSLRPRRLPTPSAAPQPAPAKTRRGIRSRRRP